MKQKPVYLLWSGLFILCAALGFIPEPRGLLKAVMTILSVVFFLPPLRLLYRADRDAALLIRNLSALSLGVTSVALILNFILAVSSETLGNILHYILVVVSAPMICSGYWTLSLFLWACLLMASLKKLKEKSV